MAQASDDASVACAAWLKRCMHILHWSFLPHKSVMTAMMRLEGKVYVYAGGGDKDQGSHAHSA